MGGHSWQTGNNLTFNVCCCKNVPLSEYNVPVGRIPPYTSLMLMEESQYIFSFRPLADCKKKKKRSIYDQFNTPLPLLASSTRFGLKFGSLFSLPEGKLSWRTYSARISLLLRLLHLSCCFFIITPPSSNHQWPLGQIVRVNLPSRDTDSNKIPKEVLPKLKISLAYMYSSKKKNATMWCYEWSLSPVQCCFVFSLALS